MNARMQVARPATRSAAAPAQSGPQLQLRVDAAPGPPVQRERAERLGHHFGRIGVSAPIQRKVLPIRSGEDQGKYRSTLTGQVYGTAEAAEQAEAEHQQQRAEQEQAVQNELASMDFAPTGGPGGQQEAVNPFSAYLGRHPAHFGPIMTQGGQVKTSEVGQAVGQKVLAPGTQPNRDSTYHSGQNTYASVFSNLEIFGESLGFNVISKEGNPTHEEGLEGTEENAGREFRDRHVFTQGTPRPEENVTLPPGRKDAHAEAQAVHSEAMRGGIRDAGDRLNHLIEAVDGVTQVSAEPTDEELEGLSQTLGLNPTASVILGLNRASCKSGSGYKGGCNQEMADSVPRFWEQHRENVGESSAGMHEALGMIGPQLSFAGPYERGSGANADPSIPLGSGMEIGIHNKFDFKGQQKGLKPLGKKQKHLLAKVSAARKQIEEARNEKKQERKRAKKEAPAWGGNGPGSVDPYDNWGENHPLHKRRRPPGDGPGGTSA